MHQHLTQKSCDLADQSFTDSEKQKFWNQSICIINKEAWRHIPNEWNKTTAMAHKWIDYYRERKCTGKEKDMPQQLTF